MKGKPHSVVGAVCCGSDKMNDNSGEFISVKQYLDTINTYNEFIEKINNIEKANSCITFGRKIRYVLCETFMNIIGFHVMLNFLFQILFGLTINEVIAYIYLYVTSLF